MKYTLDFEKPIVELEEKILALKNTANGATPGLAAEIKMIEEQCNKLKAEIYGNLTPWQRVQLARHPLRPYLLDYIPLIFGEFVELHGDRGFADDKSIVAGIGKIEDISCVIIGHQKGRTLEENLERNYGMSNPEGYRKALRVMLLGEKFSMPILTFIDTPGAYPGIGAEERGQAEAIARNLKVMSSLGVPIITTVIGEGGSGGALGIGVADKILMMENAYYSVISPEGCSSILFKDASKAPESAASLRITAQELYKLGVIDEIVAEPLGGADKDVKLAAENLKKAILKNLEELLKIPTKKLINLRYKKYRNIGEFKVARNKRINKNEK